MAFQLCRVENEKQAANVECGKGCYRSFLSLISAEETIFEDALWLLAENVGQFQTVPVSTLLLWVIQSIPFHTVHLRTHWVTETTFNISLSLF